MYTETVINEQEWTRHLNNNQEQLSNVKIKRFGGRVRQLRIVDAICDLALTMRGRYCLLQLKVTENMLETIE